MNDIILVVKKYPDSQWIKGQIGEKIGLFPGNFTRPEKQEAAVKVKALFDYDASEDNELSFKEGNVITIIGDDIEGWSVGELNGKKGMFPSNYVEKLKQ